VKSSAIAHAVYEGYGTFLAKGRHPRFVLALSVDSRHVDVNVHPTKREVRFSDQARVHEWVRSRVQAVVGPAPGPARITAVSGWTPAEGASAGTLNTPLSFVETAAEPAQPYLPSVAPEVRPMGQIANRYLLAQIGDEVQIVDQHTAHERVLFERLAAQLEAGTIVSQHSLLPQAVELSAGEAVVVRAHLEDLRRLGFEIEEFGQGTVVVRAMPALVDQSDPQALLRSLVEDWEERASTPSVQERYNAVLATMACHSAVRAGRKLEPAEMRKLLEDWRDAGFPGTCPHGRRIAMRLTIEELDRIFGRLGWT
jgi:DNA mismatch repair protein MutL